MPARDGIPLPRITEPRASLLPPSEGWGLRLVAGSGTGGLLGQPLQNVDVRALLQTQPFRCAGGEPSRLLVRNSLGTCRLSPRASLGSSREAILFSSRGPSQVGRKGVSRNYTFGRRTCSLLQTLLVPSFAPAEGRTICAPDLFASTGDSDGRSRVLIARRSFIARYPSAT